MTVAEAKSITGAAGVLRRSQSAITKAVKETEKVLGARLFERTSLGVLPNKFGELVIRRAIHVAQIMKAAELEYLDSHPKPRDVHHIPLFTMWYSTRKLWQIICLYEEENVEAAASTAGISPSAIYRTLHELEAELDLPLFARLSDGRCIAVGYGVVLAQNLKLLFSEIRHCLNEVASLQGREKGQLSVGIAGSMQPMMVPMALVKLREKHPSFEVSSKTGLFQNLLVGLKTGDIDVIAGCIGTVGNVPWLEAERLFDDKICVVARANHPLANKHRLNQTDFANVQWVHPPKGSPAHEIFEGFVADLRISNIDHFIETSSMVVQRGLLLYGDYLTLMTYQQARLDVECGILTVLPYTIRHCIRPTGLVFRRNADLSIAAQSFIEIMRDLSKEFAAADNHSSSEVAGSRGSRGHLTAVDID